MATPDQLTRALLRLPPRQLQVLSVRLLSGRGRAESAAFWAISVPAFDVLLLRAARALEAQLAGQPLPPPSAFGLEASVAQQLALALDGANFEAALAPLVTLFGEVQSQAADVSKRLREAERAAEHSPQRTFENWARRAAVLLVIALTLFFYWREQHPEPLHPHLEPRQPIHTR